MLHYYNTRLGYITTKENGKTYNLEIRQGNCLGVVIYIRKPSEREIEHGYKPSDKVAQLIAFWSDDQHCKNMLKAEHSIFPTYGDEKVVRIRLNLFYKESNTLLKYFVRSGYKVECYYEESK